MYMYSIYQIHLFIYNLSTCTCIWSVYLSIYLSIICIYLTYSWRPILDHIDTKYEKYINDESRVSRGITEDYRIHCCLYFIPPNGHGWVLYMCNKWCTKCEVCSMWCADCEIHVLVMCNVWCSQCDVCIMWCV